MVEIKNNKHIYAAYSNMAQHNFFIALKHIANIADIHINENDTKYSTAIIEKLRDSYTVPADKKEQLCDLLTRHLPFLVPVAEHIIASRRANNRIEAFCYVLPKIEDTIRIYRNYTTHYDPDVENSISNLTSYEHILTPCLKEIFKASLRTVQQRFGYLENEMKFITNKNIDTIESKYSIFKKSDLTGKFTNKETFSKRGLILFIALFLEKKYIKEMLDKTKDFYSYDDLNNSKRKSIIFESLAVYRINLPRNRYDSKETITALALDMVNELQRCPISLFNLLSREDQNLFRSEDSEGNSVLMVRHNDRFAQFALKYIDMNKMFDDIRFQINLGKYRYAFYNKKCIDVIGNDGNTHVRSLEKELHGFGRIQEIEKARKDKWATLICDHNTITPDSADSEPYITDRYASYLISNNRIGLYWKNERDETDPLLPQLTPTPKAKDLMERKRLGDKIVTTTSPKCFLSIFELPAIIFYLHLFNELDSERRKQLGLDSAEKIIINYVTNFREFVKGVQSGKITYQNCEEKANKLGLDIHHDIPRKLCEYLNFGRERVDGVKMHTRLEQRLLKQINETNLLIEQHKKDLTSIKDKRNRRGSKKFVEIKPGRLGAWLAHDMMAMQPSLNNGRDKLTGLNFQVLQSTLSVYQDFDSVKRVLVASKLAMDNREIPFLQKVMKEEPNSIADFYQIYLNEKVTWLSSLKTKDLREYGFITRGADKWKARDDNYYMQLAQKYLSMPVELPRGLFTDAIKKILADKYGESFVKGTNRDDVNVAFLISRYIKIQNDDSQEFYTQLGGKYKRHYSFFKALKGGKNATNYGMTVTEIENELKGDPTIGLIINKSNSVTSVTVPDNAKDEVDKKLAKALAKNTNLNKEDKINEIINNSQNLKKLSEAQKRALLSYAKKETPIDGGPVNDYLNQIKGENSREQERAFLGMMLRKMMAQERTIRRYKEEDIVLFIMARNLLFNGETNLNEKANPYFKLKNILPIGRQNAGSTLEIKVPFSITIYIKHSSQKIVVKQNNIKLKNYGDFLKFLYDSRIEYLIPFLVDNNNAVSIEISRDDLEKELSKYDNARHNVFEQAHKLEKLILERHIELKDNHSEKYYCAGSKKPIRNNFKSLLEFGSLQLNTEERQELIDIRNSFSHNTYPSKNGQTKIKITKNNIGEIAEAIRDKMTERIGNIDNKK